MFQSLVFFTLAPFAAVSAVDLCAYSNDLGCFGPGAALCCAESPEHSCCGPIPPEFGLSIFYNALPGPVSEGQAWTSANCFSGGIFTDVTNTGNKCYVGGGQKVGSISWASVLPARAGLGMLGIIQPNLFKYR
ncbi:hypothetical protein C8R43DRAFT_359695 [Mycena crocata]|nr:hypothetical protein C8R43DRAFT_359695 [Mycena crocata]